MLAGEEMPLTCCLLDVMFVSTKSISLNVVVAMAFHHCDVVWLMFHLCADYFGRDV